MRKLFILSILLIAVMLNAQGVHKTIWVKSNDNVATWPIGGAVTADTSWVIPTYPTMSFGHFAADTAGNDSVNLTISFQVHPDTSLVTTITAWKTVESWTVTADSTYEDEMITDNAIVNFKHGRFIVSANAGNATISDVLLYIIYGGYSTVRNGR